VFAGGIVDRGLRWVLKWGLSYALGPAGLGLFELAQKIGSTVTSFSPLGLDTGVIYFAARQRKGGERAALKGTLYAGGGLALGVGALAGVLLFVLAPQLADEPDAVTALRFMAPVVVVWTPLLFAVGALRAMKDMRRSVLAFQVVLPAVLIAGTALAVGPLGAGVPGAIAAMGVATAVALLLAARFAWRHYKDVLGDRSLEPHFEVGELLRFSIPQSLTAAAFRLNLYMDVLMLGLLASREDVGIYAIAASLASFGSVPANAVVSIFNPFIAELVYSGETARLDRLLKTVTRWLVVVAVPVYLALLLLPDVVLSVYDDAFAAAALPLVVLTVGQAINTACAPTMRLIPMSGHAMLNLVNGVIALALNVALNWFLIPEYGALGAALATGLTLALWSLWRVVEVWFLLKCFPFGWRALVLMAVSAAGGGALFFLGDAWSLAPRLGAAVGLGVCFLALALAVGRTPEDRAVLGRVQGRLKRLLGRR
jgi:O-antigen/teichoic acid export membrane protein